MLVRYIEDNVVDATFVKELLQGDTELDVSVCETLDQVKSQSFRNEDCALLVDVMRPDAISIEDDVRRLREYSSAPIVFITGGDADEFRARAVSAGARDVLDKARLSVELVREVFGLGIDPSAYVPAEPEPVSPASHPNHRMHQLEVPLCHLEYGLSSLLECSEDQDRPVTSTFISHMLRTVKTIRSYATEDLSTLSRVPMHDVMGDIASQCDSFVKAKEIDFQVEGDWAWFGQIGGSDLGRLGLYHLVEALLVAAPPKTTLKITVEKNTNGAYLNFYASQEILPSADTFFGQSGVAERDLDLAARSSLRLAVMLLSLSPEQVVVRNLSGVQFIRVSL